MLEPSTLPKARRVSPVAAHALALYDRLEQRPAYPAADLKRRALSARLDRVLRDMEPSDRASYYAGLVERRGRS